MQQWLHTIWRIALLRAGPQDMPASLLSTGLALLAYFTVVVAAGALDQRPIAGTDLLISILLPLVAAAVVLNLAGKAARLNQTVAALFGTGALISLVNLPLWLSDTTPVPPLLVLIALAALFWSLAVEGHIWRHAIECSFAGGVAIAVVILVVQLFAFQALGTP